MAIYLAAQNKSFEVESTGGYLWSPQKGNRQGNPFTPNQYKMMRKVKKGDYILNACDQKIKAISVALNDCYEAKKPNDKIYSRYEGFQVDGYRFDAKYYKLVPEIGKTDVNKYAINHPEENTCFKKNGDFRVAYMCSLTKNNADYILNKILEKQQDDDVIKILKDAIKQNEESSSESIKNDDESEIVFSKIYGPGKVENKTPCGDGLVNVHVEFFECVGNKKYIFQMPEEQDKNSSHVPIKDIDNKE